MSGPEIMAVVAFFIVVATFAFGLWKYIDSKLIATNVRVDGAAALAAQARYELAEHKLHTAEHYVSKQGLRETTDQIMAAISGVKVAVDGMTLRIDRVVENQQPPKPTRRTSS